MADVANILVPGKREASILLVANGRTAAALPKPIRDRPTLMMVENGVDLELFKVPEDEYVRPEASFTFVGRLVDWKRVDLLLQAVSMLPKHVTLNIIGDGPMRSVWEAHSRHLGLTDRVRFEGQASQDECAIALTHTTALVLPSIYECGGAVVLEAMAAGVPVIATNWGGPADYIIQGETGFLIEPDSAQEYSTRLADAMSQILSNPDLARKMGIAGRERAAKYFDWTTKIQNITVIYSSAIDQYRHKLSTSRRGRRP
ncbi:glycosyltransferase family 4 protein [uncultured Amnibacterium sp.]|uniref:glycosyltransferase family 4 protein n=1 Tax=uncultured Amnibacterium sp. TaxID=1631851 RepID=UPI0035C9FC4A